MARTVKRHINTRIIVSYTENANILTRREVVKVKDTNNVWNTVSDTSRDVGRKAIWRKDLVEDRQELTQIRNRTTTELDNEIDFINDQITEIDAL